MELRHLRYFVAVAEELHFGRAANRLHIAQPALSQQIRKLEEELNVKLFFRSKRRVELTHAGRVFLVEAQQILSRAERAAQAAKRADRGEIGPLALACGAVAIYTLLPLVLPAYRARFPGTDIRIRECLMTEGVEALEDGSADVGLLFPYFHSEMLKHETVLRVPLVAVLPKSHPLAQADRISLKQLAKDPFILFAHRQGSGFYERVVGVCQKAGFVPKVIEGVEHFRTMLVMVAAGYGVSLVPRLPEGTAGREVAYARLREPYATVEICMAWRATESSPLVAAFLDATRASCREGSREKPSGERPKK